MDNQTIIALTTEVNNAKSNSELDLLESKYSFLSNPYKSFLFGLAYLRCDDNNNAHKNFLNAIREGVKNKENFSNSHYSHCIGSSFYYILTHFPIENADVRFNYFVNSYFYLSSMINAHNISAYESYETRAKLFLSFEDTLTIRLCGYIGRGQIATVLILSDYYFAACGYKKFDMQSSSAECLNEATELHEWLEDITIAGQDADSYSLENLSLIGKARHDLLFKNAYDDFASDKFPILMEG